MPSQPDKTIGPESLEDRWRHLARIERERRVKAERNMLQIRDVLNRLAVHPLLTRRAGPLEQSALGVVHEGQQLTSDAMSEDRDD